MLRPHARIAVGLGIVSKSRLLFLARRGNPFANCTGGFFQAFARHITILNRRHFNVEIDPIEQRSGDPLPVTLDLTRTTTAFAFQVAEITARTRIHRRDQHEFAWESDAASCSRNGDASILQWLAHHLQSLAMKFRELVEKEN